MSKSIQEIPEADRPREKLLRKGAKALSDQELLAILLGKGTPGMDVMTLAAKLVRLVDEKGLEVKAEDLSQFAGVGDAKATLILAAIEFARRRIKPDGAKIETPADLLPHVRHYADRKQEHFLCASINGANEILNIRVVSIGLIDRSPVHPREVFADALSDRASAIIVAHNHPSGGLDPSANDIEITAQLKGPMTRNQIRRNYHLDDKEQRDILLERLTAEDLVRLDGQTVTAASFEEFITALHSRPELPEAANFRKAADGGDQA